MMEKFCSEFQDCFCVISRNYAGRLNGCRRRTSRPRDWAGDPRMRPTIPAKSYFMGYVSQEWSYLALLLKPIYLSF
jgi:hypothetical protein